MSHDAALNLAADISRIAEQERRLRFARFDLELAWQLGTRLRDIAQERAMPLVIELRIAGATVFHSAMSGTAPANADWARRKRNTVELLHRSSYGVGLSLKQDGLTLHQLMGLDPRDHATHGGSFPLQIDGLGCIGAVTVSGAPQREDHAIVVTALAQLCNVPEADVAMD